MSGYTGYIASSGYDLSLIFQGGTTNITTGFKLANGDDIATIFSAFSIGSTPASSTGLISVGGGDISTLFNWISAFLPLDIGGCCLWMDANDSSTISPAPTNNSTINAWTDKSPNAYVFNSPITTTAKPKFASSSQNGKSTIAFASGSLQYFVGDNPSKSFALNTSSYALFAVYQRTNASAGIYNKSILAGVANRMLLAHSSGNLVCGFSHNNAPSKISDTANAITTYQIVSFTINRNAGLDTSYVNGTTAGTYSYTSDSSTNFLATAYDTLIGAYNSSSGTGPDSTFYLTGNICEIISYKNAGDMTNDTRQKLEGYLAYKWGLQSLLPSLHPYKNSQF